MKSCTDCKYAKWDRTKAGRLSPTGNGVCYFPVKPIVLPNAHYFIGGTPNLCGGYINRTRVYSTDCPCGAREQIGGPQ